MTTQQQVRTNHPQYVSQEGLQVLRQRLNDFKQQYTELRARLADLRQVKDAEDFDLIDETMQLAFLEKEITTLQNVLASCQVVTPDPKAQVVQIGSKVRLEHSSGELHCKIVTPIEADPSEGKISDQSPLGRALLGKMINSLVEVMTPRARQKYKIVEIK